MRIINDETGKRLVDTSRDPEEDRREKERLRNAWMAQHPQHAVQQCDCVKGGTRSAMMLALEHCGLWELCRRCAVELLEVTADYARWALERGT